MRFRGLVYRAHNPQWSWTPLSGEGARRHGGRFNRRGIPALYTSLSPLTAIREAQPLGRPMQPLTLYACEVDVEPVVDALDEDQSMSGARCGPFRPCMPHLGSGNACGCGPCIAGLGRPPDRGGLCRDASPEFRRGGRYGKSQSRGVEVGFRPSAPRRSHR